MNSKFPGPCDDKKWGRTELWDVFEASHVLVDIEPSTDPDPYFEPEADALYKQLAMSIAMGYPQIAQQIGNRHLFLPLQMVDWALKKGYPVSGALQAEVIRTARENIDRLSAAKAQRASVPPPSAPNGEPKIADVDTLSDDQRADPVYMAAYKRAWELYDELDEWKAMKHGGDPFRAIAIGERIDAINGALAELNSTGFNGSTRADLQSLCPAPPSSTLEDGLRQSDDKKNEAKKPSEPFSNKGDSAAAAAKRRNADITRERGARRRIIEKWDAIEMEYGLKIDGRIVLQVLKRDKGEDQPDLKTVQNHISKLRAEGLIP